MAKLNGTLTFVDKNGEDKSIVRVIDDLTEIKIGNHLSNDILIKSEDVEELHCKIYFNEIHRIMIKNYSKSHPILVNNKVVDGSKELKSSDVITILENSMRWETKDDAKRRISFLSKEERKAMKRKYIKTNKRITIHSVSVQSMTKSCLEEVASSSSSSTEKLPTPEIPEEAEEIYSPVKEQQEIPKDKENEKTPVKVNKLNMSGTLLTSYTPPVGKLTRSVSKTPYNSPIRSPLVKSAAKNILNDSLNNSKLSTPKSAQKLNNSQMHLIDLTTPFTKRTESTSTPKTTSSIRKTPKTIGKTPLRNATLLKSAIKNSSIQKQVMQNVSSISTKGKQLFESPVKNNTPIKEDEPSLIEISMSSVSEIDSTKSTINDNSSCEVQKVEESNGKSTTDEVKDLLKSIDSVLDESKVDQPDEIQEPVSSSQELEDNFNKLVDDQKSSIDSVNESIFDKALNNAPIEDINNFDKLVTDEGTSSVDDTEKKGEIVMKLIEKARESLSTPNKTTQVLSARYSNITNDSLTDTVNTSQKYDATTPKISLLETVMSGRKSDLSIGPVSRLSLTKDSTEIVENYQLSNNNSESLRSTRKRMRTAMSSIGILNASLSADTTLNESLNVSTHNNDQPDLNQSQPEETNILSLDNQPDLNTSNKENEYSGSLNMSMKFIEYSEVDENNQESKKIFELSNEGDDLVDSDIESESDEDVEDSPDDEDVVDEAVNDDIMNEVIENVKEVVESNNVSVKKCRISQADLEILGEEGISILEQSRDEDQLEEMLQETEETENKAIEEIEQIVENNGTDEIKAPTETEKDNNGINEFEEIPETQEIELEEDIAEKSEYLDESDIPATQELVDIEKRDSDLFDDTVHSNAEINESEVAKESELNETEDIQALPENETSQVASERLDDTVEDSFNEHVEIPATQAFEYDDSIIEERLDDSTINIKEEVNLIQRESSGSIYSVDDSTIVSSQEPVNNSENIESVSIQEISDTSELCSQESNIARKGSSLQGEDLISETESSKSIVDTACVEQESKEEVNDEVSNEKNCELDISAVQQTSSDISEPVNEENCLSDKAEVQQTSSETTESANEKNCSTEIFETLDPFEYVLDDEEVVEENTTNGDSAIGTTVSKIDESNENEKVADESLVDNSPVQNRESVLFSDTEFSHVELNASEFLKETDSDEFTEIKNNQELTETETNKPQTDLTEEDKSDKEKELIKTELEKVDLEKKFIRKGYSIMPSEIEKPTGSRQTLIPDSIDDSFAAFIENKQSELKKSEVLNDQEKTVQEDSKVINEEIQESEIVDEKETSNELDSTVSEEKIDEIEMELARINDEPIAKKGKKRPASLMPQFDDGDNSNNASSRMTMIPTEDDRRMSFIEDLENEKVELLKQKESLDVQEEKPAIEDDKDGLKVELNSDIQEDDQMKNKEPVVEEPCIKKQAYVTTENEKEVKEPETPSRRRVARVNYSELATGSPARSRRGRSASTESNDDKELKSAAKRKEKRIKMEPIVEDDTTLQITVTATENSEQVVESNTEVPTPSSEEILTETKSETNEKEPENLDTKESIEKTVDSVVDKELLPQEEISNDQNNEVVPESIEVDTQKESVEPETHEQQTESLQAKEVPKSENHEVTEVLEVSKPEELQVMEVPKPEEMQVMEVPKPKDLQVMEVPKPEELQVMEVPKPEELQVMEIPKPQAIEVTESAVEVTKSNDEHPKESEIEEAPKDVESELEETENTKPIDEEVVTETENVVTKHSVEEPTVETSEVVESNPIDDVDEKIEDEIITPEDPVENDQLEPERDENIEKDSIKSESVKEVTENVIEISESVESINEDIVQKELVEPSAEKPSTDEEKAAEELPSESISKEQEVAPKTEVELNEPKTPSRKRAKKLNYLELASGSPARTPRRARAASTEEKPEKSTELDLPQTIPEEASDKSPAEDVKSTNEDLATAEAKSQEVKKKPGRARKIEQLKNENEDVPTPSKRSRRGATPVQTQAPVNEPEKKSRKRQQKPVDPEPEKSEVEESEEAAKEPEIIDITSTQSVPEAAKPVAKRGRGKQAKVVEEVPNDEKAEEPHPAKKGRGRKVKVDEAPIVEEKLPEKVEASPKRGRGRKVVEESHDEKATETPVANKSRNKRQQEKPAETELPKDTEVVNETTSEVPESPKQAKKRAAKPTEEVEEQSQPEKTTVAPKRGRKGKLEAVPEVQEPQKEETTTKRSGRKGKVEEIPESQEEPAVVAEAPKKGRGRKKVEEAPTETAVEPEKIEEAPKRGGKKAEKKNDVAEPSVPEATTEESVPKRGGRKGKLETIAAEIESNSVQGTPKRARKGKVEATPVIPEEPKQAEEIVAPKKGGRKAKVEVATESQEPEPVVQEAPKKGRGRKKVEEVPTVDETPASDVQEEPVPVKKGRGRQAKMIETKTDEKTEPETEAPKRGRAQKHKEATPDTTEQPVVKKPRGRQVKQKAPSQEPESQPETPVKRKAGGKQVTIITPSTMQAHHSKEKSEEPVVAKRTTKRQATQPIIEEEPVAAKRSTRVRK